MYLIIINYSLNIFIFFLYFNTFNLLVTRKYIFKLKYKINNYQNYVHKEISNCHINHY